MTFIEGLQLAIEVCAIAGFGFGAANRWAVANHRDRLAMFTGAAANAAGRIRLELSELPPGADLAETRRILLDKEVTGMMREFDTTGPAISATAGKAEDMILGQLKPAAAPPGVP